MEQRRCPNCGRKLAESEMYCYFCDADLKKLEESRKDGHKK